jgi:hypothetical protein
MLWSSLAAALAEPTVMVNTTEQTSSIELDARSIRFVSAATAKIPETTVVASGYGIGFTKYFVPVFGLNVELGQIFGDSQGSTSAILTSLGVGVRYRPFAQHMLVRESAVVDGRSFVTTNYERQGEVFLSLGVSQLTINTSKGAVPYNGMVFGIGYEWPFLDSWGARIMMSRTSASNDKTSISVTTTLLGLSYAL